MRLRLALLLLALGAARAHAYVDAYANTVLADSPAMYYPMSEATCTSGTKADDLACFNDGMYFATSGTVPTCGETALTATAGRTSVRYTANTAFDDNRIQGPTAANSAVGPTSPTPATLYGDFTAEVWAKPNTNTPPNGTPYRMSPFGSRAGGGFGLQLKFAKDNNSPFTESIQALVADSGSAAWCSTSISVNFSWSVGTVYHVVLTGGATTWELFMDGSSVGSGGYATTSPCSPLTWDGSHTFYFGAGGDLDDWDGWLQDGAVYPSVLSGARILAHYNCGHSSTSCTTTQVITPCSGGAVWPWTARRELPAHPNRETWAQALDDSRRPLVALAFANPLGAFCLKGARNGL